MEKALNSAHSKEGGLFRYWTGGRHMIENIIIMIQIQNVDIYIYMFVGFVSVLEVSLVAANHEPG